MQPAAPAPHYRWVVLGVGTFGQAAVSAVRLGMPALAPALRDRFTLSLTETGVVLASVSAGIVLGLIPFGALADRVGERRVLSAGLAGTALALVAAAFAESFAGMLAALVAAGVLGSSATGATARSVMGWFARSERGMALGIRQTGLPLGGALAALTLPGLAQAGGLRLALLALAGLCVAASLAVLGWMREPPPGHLAGRPLVDSPRPLRDPRIWRLGSAGGLLVVAQVGILSFLVLYLVDERGWSPAGAAAGLAAIQVLGAVARVGVGRWSDRIGWRIEPMRRIALLAAGSLVLAAALSSAPAAFQFGALLVAGVLAMSWNGLSFTAAAEISGRHQAATATSLQNTILSLMGVLAPIGFAVLVSAAGWHVGWIVLAASQVAGALVVAPLALDEARRRRARERRLRAASGPQAGSATLGTASETSRQGA